MLRRLCMLRSFRALVPLLLVARIAIVALVIVALFLHLSRDESRAR